MGKVQQGLVEQVVVLEYKRRTKMAFHIAPIIREMEEARQTVGLLPAGTKNDSVGYTLINAQEAAGTRPTPKVTADGGIGNFWFLNQKTVPAL